MQLKTTTTTTILQQLYRSTCVSQHLKIKTGGFCWCKVLLPARLAGSNQHIQIKEKTDAGVLLNYVIYLMNIIKIKY